MKKVTLSYGSQRDQFGELSLPDQGNNEKVPVVVSIHGGFWKDKFNLSDFYPLDEQLVEAGFATWNIEYRRVGQSGGGYPQTFQDVSLAINYLATIAEQYPIDLNQVVVIGHSAGGHLALWSASRYHHEHDELGEPINIKFIGVVSMAGVTDLQEMWLDQQNTDMADTVSNFMGGTPEQLPNRYLLASPIDLLPLGVKTYLVHGDNDDRVPVELSKSYYEKALQSGEDVQLIEIPGAGHFDLTNKDAKAWDATKQAIFQIVSD
ncbi:alpha/beta hydrolase [Leuconostocaceae bacterium ESL0723]|nr:alpha/beta hydrolase [Leuconostocaceae bacterium ESL0723]